MKKILSLWDKWSTLGIKVPYIHDPVSREPSVTLMFPYITFVVSMISLVLLHIWPSILVATGASIMFWAISVVFYLLRKLHKSKINISKGIIELEKEDND